jgi:hypothetical protein
LEDSAIEVLERLVGEDDQSVEVWYLGGWGLYLMGQKRVEAKDAEEGKVLLISARMWLHNSLRLYDLLEYEDDRLRDHALELVESLNGELGEPNAADEEDGDDWEDEDGEEDEEDEEDEGDTAMGDA